MPYVCAVKNCPHYADRQNKYNCHYEKIPSNNDIFYQWIKILGKPELLIKSIKNLKKNTYVCHCHFKDDDFKPGEKTNSKRELKPTAMPTQNNNCPPLTDDQMNQLGQCIKMETVAVSRTIPVNHSTASVVLSSGRALIVPKTVLGTIPLESPGKVVVVSPPVNGISLHGNLQPSLVNKQPAGNDISLMNPLMIQGSNQNVSSPLRVPLHANLKNNRTNKIAVDKVISGKESIIIPNNNRKPLHTLFKITSNVIPSLKRNKAENPLKRSLAHFQPNDANSSQMKKSPLSPLSHKSIIPTCTDLPKITSSTQEVQSDRVQDCPSNSVLSMAIPIRSDTPESTEPSASTVSNTEDTYKRNIEFGEFIAMQLNLLDSQDAEKVIQNICGLLYFAKSYFIFLLLRKRKEV